MKTLYLLERYLSPRPALVRGQGQQTLPICERGRSRVQRTETCGALPKSSLGTSSVRNQPKASLSRCWRPSVQGSAICPMGSSLSWPD
jgi:hypothetical protein